MAPQIFTDHEQCSNFIVAVVAIPVTVFVVSLRVLSTVRAGKGVGRENWFALLALLAFLVYASIDLWSKCFYFGVDVFFRLMYVLYILAKRGSYFHFERKKYPSGRKIPN